MAFVFLPRCTSYFLNIRKTGGQGAGNKSGFMLYLQRSLEYRVLYTLMTCSKSIMNSDTNLSIVTMTF